MQSLEPDNTVADGVGMANAARVLQRLDTWGIALTAVSASYFDSFVVSQVFALC